MKKAFTLIELMIVIAIIAVIAAIAIPNLLAARILANEAAAISTLKSIHAAQNVYREMDPDQDGEFRYGLMNELVDAGLMTMPHAEGNQYHHHGYRITSRPSSNPELRPWVWAARANPVVKDRTGHRHFFVNHQGQVMFRERTDIILISLNETMDPPTDLVALGR